VKPGFQVTIDGRIRSNSYEKETSASLRPTSKSFASTRIHQGRSLAAATQNDLSIRDSLTRDSAALSAARAEDGAFTSRRALCNRRPCVSKSSTRLPFATLRRAPAIALWRRFLFAHAEGKFRSPVMVLRRRRHRLADERDAQQMGVVQRSSGIGPQRLSRCSSSEHQDLAADMLKTASPSSSRSLRPRRCASTPTPGSGPQAI